MGYEQTYLKLISGQRKGPGAVVFRFFLGIAAIGYSIVIRFRNFLYNKGYFKKHQVNAVVISIGNITVGGTGKTPLVIWMCKQIQNFKSQITDYNCAVLTRGYKSQTQQQTSRIDEVAILTESCPEAEVIVNPDRVAGAIEAIDKFGAQVLILDDGFQHRRLARNLDILAIDATQPFGYERIFPAGLLREPVASLKRADAVIITRCDLIAGNELKRIEDKLVSVNPDIIIARSIHAPTDVIYLEPLVIPAEAGIQKSNEKIDSCLRRNDSAELLKGQKIFAFCGIGNPEAFLGTIRNVGAQLVGSKVYNDHYHYTGDCINDIYKQGENLKADLILTTKKDWTKIISDFRSQISDYELSLPFAYLEIEIKFLSGEDKLTHLIEKTLAGTISK
jgi:tetraacyldisaccharide 4'-kinase